MEPLSGIIPIIAVPYTIDGRISTDDLRREVDHLVSTGFHTCGIGFASDILRQTDAERDLIVRTISSATDRPRLIVSCGAHSVVAATNRATALRDAGADVLMVTPPGSLGQPTPAAIADYYDAIARAAELPLVIQDAPQLTGTEMTVDTLVNLAREVPGVIALKIESVPAGPKISQLVNALGPATPILGGSGGAEFITELERGAAGTVPGAGTPVVFQEIYDLFTSGERDAAHRLFYRLLPLIDFANRSYDTFLFTQLELLRRHGVVSGTSARAPHERLDEAALRAELDKLLTAAGSTLQEVR